MGHVCFPPPAASNLLIPRQICLEIAGCGVRESSQPGPGLRALCTHILLGTHKSLLGWGLSEGTLSGGGV